MNEKIRFVRRFVKAQYAYFDKILQIKTDKGWEDVDLNSLGENIQWENPREKRKYDKACEREMEKDFTEKYKVSA
jgi:hypothetical protein